MFTKATVCRESAFIQIRIITVFIFSSQLFTGKNLQILNHGHARQITRVVFNCLIFIDEGFFYLYYPSEIAFSGDIYQTPLKLGCGGKL